MISPALYLPSAAATAIKGGVHRVEVPFVESVGNKTQRFAEPLVMHDLSGAQEFHYVAHIRIVAQAQDVVVGDARFLLCCTFVRTTFCCFF